jgi:hypothetical protein
VLEAPLSIKGRYAVTQDNIVKFAEPGPFEDPLTEVLRCVRGSFWPMCAMPLTSKGVQDPNRAYQRHYPEFPQFDHSETPKAAMEAAFSEANYAVLAAVQL